MNRTRSSRGEAAGQLIRGEKQAVLCTLSQKVHGWPFGSVAPYALAACGEPLLLISEIAEHTRNLRADPRASLLIADSETAQDPQAGARVTLMGKLWPLGEAELPDARQVYLQRFPDARDFFQAHDFTFFSMRTEHVRYIGGFGNIHWIRVGELFPERDAFDPLAAVADEICAHMNADHAEALPLYARAFAGAQLQAPKMIHVDSRGFEVCDPAEGAMPVRIEFPHPVSSREEVRRVMVQMLQQARAR